VATSKVIQDTSVPVKNKTIRITDSNNTWILEKLGPDKTRVIYRNYTNASGNVPKTVANMISKDIPFYTLVNMRNLAKEPIYKEIASQYCLE
jgi:hypothetical protein